MKLLKKGLFPGLTLVLFGIAMTGCPKAKGPTPDVATTEPADAAPVDTLLTPSVPTVSVGTDFATAPEFLDTVTFEYMKADLTALGPRQSEKKCRVLKAILKAASSVKVRVEGHCDDRGTLEYNMALSQRRAKVVRDYYATLGISKRALDTIPTGKTAALHRRHRRVLGAESTERDDVKVRHARPNSSAEVNS